MTRAKGKKLLSDMTSSIKGTLIYRGVKVVMPECHVPKLVHGKTEYTTGPCQQAVKDNKALAFSWFKHCTHGPSIDEDGNEIPPELRPYYETAITVEKTPVVQAGVISEWRETPRYSAKLRIRDIAWGRGVMGGFSVRGAQQRGARPIEDFDVAPFCELYGCKRQTSTDSAGKETPLKKYANGYFCTDSHAKLVKAAESGIILHTAWDGKEGGWAVSSEKHAEEMAQIEV